jgi:hypothetical protein
VSIDSIIVNQATLSPSELREHVANLDTPVQQSSQPDGTHLANLHRPNQYSQSLKHGDDVILVTPKQILLDNQLSFEDVLDTKGLRTAYVFVDSLKANKSSIDNRGIIVTGPVASGDFLVECETKSKTKSRTVSLRLDANSFIKNLNSEQRGISVFTVGTGSDNSIALKIKNPDQHLAVDGEINLNQHILKNSAIAPQQLKIAVNHRNGEVLLGVSPREASITALKNAEDTNFTNLADNYSCFRLVGDTTPDPTISKKINLKNKWTIALGNFKHNWNGGLELDESFSPNLLIQSDGTGNLIFSYGPNDIEVIPFMNLTQSQSNSDNQASQNQDKVAHQYLQSA